MSNELFDKATIDKIVDRVKKDKSGRMGLIMQEIMDVCEKAGKSGFTMKELSIISTTGWYLSQNPELRKFFDQLMSMPPPKEDDVWN
jgi:hypothetical protein